MWKNKLFSRVKFLCQCSILIILKSINTWDVWHRRCSQVRTAVLGMEKVEPKKKPEDSDQMWQTAKQQFSRNFTFPQYTFLDAKQRWSRVRGHDIRPFQDNLHLHKGQRVYFGQACHFWFPCDSNKQGSYVSEGGRRSLIHGLRSEIKHKWKERTALSWDWYFLLVQGHWTRTTEIYTVIVKLFQFAEGAGNFFLFF